MKTIQPIDLGIAGNGKVYRNLAPAQLVEFALSRGEGRLSDTGALVVKTGKYTGRSPDDKFIVDTPAVHQDIAWGNINRPIAKETYEAIKAKMLAYLQNKELFVFDGFAGADPKYTKRFRIVNELASQNLFIHQLLIRPTEAELEDYTPDYTILAAPGFKCIPEVDGTHSEAAIIIDYEAHEVLIAGSQWNSLSKKMENLQARWKSIGFASKKDNQKIYERFRAACDKFYNSKREFYSKFKDVMQENLRKKEDLCEQAEKIKDSEDWKKATDQLINLQNVWKTIGPVARKQSDAVWKRFRAACDEFFARKAKHFGDEGEKFEENLKAKKAVIEEIKAYQPKGGDADKDALNEFISKWNSIGFVPFKEKENLQKEYDAALNLHFADIRDLDAEKKMGRIRRLISDAKNPGKSDRGIRTEREKLLNKFRKLETDIATLENNMGFFAKSKNADKLIEDIKSKIAAGKEELKSLEQKIKMIDKEF